MFVWDVMFHSKRIDPLVLSFCCIRSVLRAAHAVRQAGAKLGLLRGDEAEYATAHDGEL